MTALTSSPQDQTMTDSTMPTDPKDREMVERDDAIRIYGREAVLRLMHDHNGWPAPHMAGDELLDLAEATARATIKAYLARCRTPTPTAPAPGDAQPMSAPEVEGAIADAIKRADVGYRMELTRLVDGESTYTLTYGDGTVFTFSDTDEVYAHVRETKRKAQAREVLAALSVPTAPAQSEPFGYWVEQKHAEPVLLRKPSYIPEPSDLRTVTPLYSAPAQSDDRVKALEEALRRIDKLDRGELGDGAIAYKALSIARAALAPVHTPDTAQGGGEGR